MSLLRKLARHAQRNHPTSSSAATICNAWMRGLSTTTSCASSNTGTSTQQSPAGAPNLHPAAAPSAAAPTGAAAAAAAAIGLKSASTGGGPGGPLPTGVGSTARVAAAGWASVPAVAKTLGIGGVLPFIALSPPIAAMVPFFPADLVANAALLQIGYGASICSFLGGVHWGAAFGTSAGAVGMEAVPVGLEAAAMGQPNFERYSWGIIPCLMAWPAVTMASGPGAFVIASTLAVTHVADRSFARRQLLPPWYMWLRVPLTAFAMVGMGITVYDSIASEFRRTTEPPPTEALLSDEPAEAQIA